MRHVALVYIFLMRRDSVRQSMRCQHLVEKSASSCCSFTRFNSCCRVDTPHLGISYDPFQCCEDSPCPPLSSHYHNLPLPFPPPSPPPPPSSPLLPLPLLLPLRPTRPLPFPLLLVTSSLPDLTQMDTAPSLCDYVGWSVQLSDSLPKTTAVSVDGRITLVSDER